MLINTSRRSALWLSLLPIILVFIYLGSHRDKLASPFQIEYSIEDASIRPPHHDEDVPVDNAPAVDGERVEEQPIKVDHDVPGRLENPIDPAVQDPKLQETPPTLPLDAAPQHREVFSTTTADKKYFLIDFLHSSALNPNIIPHPTEADAWILTAQLLQSPRDAASQAPPDARSHSVWCAELTCTARFDVEAGTLRCVSEPLILPIGGTTSTQCSGNVEMLSMSIGPHDARVFYGPDHPYAIWGSQSAYTCFGQWLVDFRVLVDWDSQSLWKVDLFRTATEIKRPAPWAALEKNWFVFWDVRGDMYVHHDIAPARVFAKLDVDGSVGEDLAPLARVNDEKCMQRYMPRIPPDDAGDGGTKHSIHQATNSLAITLCRRSDPACQRTEANTLIMTIIHVKTWDAKIFHSTYEPYVVLFSQTAPFALHSIAQRPIWIHGRSTSVEKPEMMYVTSMSWMKQGMMYHGFLDDVLFLAFGIEDKGTGGIDIVAGELLRDLGVCSDMG
ncbi:hypothetical protein PVAG01_08026 [Phlyctema vagabunda]|uniref:Uncharacterized protein n=1 Tax=Phlyctema vagabunda TaxID=108571 RepID=A0ABR4PE78_9HELO